MQSSYDDEFLQGCSFREYHEEFLNKLIDSLKEKLNYDNVVEDFKQKVLPQLTSEIMNIRTKDFDVKTITRLEEYIVKRYFLAAEAELVKGTINFYGLDIKSKIFDDK